MGIAENTISKKNEKIKNTDIIVEYNGYGHNMYCYIIKIKGLIEPQMRPRTGKFKNIYDPMKKYKEIIREKIMKEINTKNIPLHKGNDYYVKSEIYVWKKPPISWSISKQYEALLGNIPFNTKPDIDNIIKTIYDSCEKIFFENDSEIVSEYINKSYDVEDSIKIVFLVNKINYNKNIITKKNIDSKIVDNDEIKNFLLERMNK